MIPGVLSRYILGQNLFLLAVCLGVGTGIYLVTDLFDRIDDFVEAGLGFKTALWYFTAKLPLIISQILPAVFLMATVIQLGLMARGRELLALRSGGVGPWTVIRTVAVYALVLSVAQLFFSQWLGVSGLRISSSIWRDQVRKHDYARGLVKDVWFKQGNFVVEARRAAPDEKTAWEVSVFTMGGERESVDKVLRAPEARIGKGVWTLTNATVFDTNSFANTFEPSLELPISQDLSDFLAVNRSDDPSKLPVWKLGRIIENLQASGSNVERLRTVYHMKFAYGFAIFTMALVALALFTFSENVYLNIGLSLVTTFAFYVFYMLGGSAGEKGLLPPLLAAWSGNILFSTLAAMRLAWVSLPSGKATATKKR